jgi:hypothetical protein
MRPEMKEAIFKRNEMKNKNLFKIFSFSAGSEKGWKQENFLPDCEYRFRNMEPFLTESENRVRNTNPSCQKDYSRYIPMHRTQKQTK